VRKAVVTCLHGDPRLTYFMVLALTGHDVQGRANSVGWTHYQYKTRDAMLNLTSFPAKLLAGWVHLDKNVYAPLLEAFDEVTRDMQDSFIEFLFPDVNMIKFLPGGELRELLRTVTASLLRFHAESQLKYKGSTINKLINEAAHKAGIIPSLLRQWCTAINDKFKLDNRVHFTMSSSDGAISRDLQVLHAMVEKLAGKVDTLSAAVLSNTNSADNCADMVSSSLQSTPSNSPEERRRVLTSRPGDAEATTSTSTTTSSSTSTTTSSSAGGFLRLDGIPSGNFGPILPNPSHDLSSALNTLSSGKLITASNFGQTNYNIGTDREARRVLSTFLLTSKLINPDELDTLVKGSKGVTLTKVCHAIEARVKAHVNEKGVAVGSSKGKCKASMSGLGAQISNYEQAEKRSEQAKTKGKRKGEERRGGGGIGEKPGEEQEEEKEKDDEEDDEGGGEEDDKEEEEEEGGVVRPAAKKPSLFDMFK